jgi:uncharacterized membrane protein YeiB
MKAIAPQEATGPWRPMLPGERVLALDALRGFAVLGLLAVIE